jgi:hypothetical protein
MSTVEEITRAIGKLPKEEFWKLTDRLMELRDKVWDQQMGEDTGCGSLEMLWEKAETEIASGQTTSLDEFLRHQELPK